jgi:signal recognition particle GTPase
MLSPVVVAAGAGKTTTCTKYAHLWKKKGYKPAMVRQTCTS